MPKSYYFRYQVDELQSIVLIQCYWKATYVARVFFPIMSYSLVIGIMLAVYEANETFWLIQSHIIDYIRYYVSINVNSRQNVILSLINNDLFNINFPSMTPNNDNNTDNDFRATKLFGSADRQIKEDVEEIKTTESEKMMPPLPQTKGSDEFAVEYYKQKTALNEPYIVVQEDQGGTSSIEVLEDIDIVSEHVVSKGNEK